MFECRLWLDNNVLHSSIGPGEIYSCTHLLILKHVVIALWHDSVMAYCNFTPISLTE